jgi:hypothetical protein
MSIIPIIYNQGTGLINPIGEGADLPIIVGDLVVNCNLTVLGNSNHVGTVTCDTNLTVDDTIASADLIVTNNAIIGDGIGHDNATLFVLPVVNGSLNQVLTIVQDAVSPIETAWVDAPTVTDYVQYDLLTSRLINNVLTVQTPIDNLTVDTSIGITGQRFKLPSNTTSATNNQVLAILNSAVTPKTTSWITPILNSPTTFNTNQFGINTITGVVTVVINSNLLLAGLYMVSYETAIQNTASRTFTSRQTCIGSTPDFINPVRGLYTSDFISSIIPIAIQRETGCAVVLLSATTNLYLVVQNVFTGLPYLTTGSFRTAKIG